MITVSHYKAVGPEDTEIDSQVMKGIVLDMGALRITTHAGEFRLTKDMPQVVYDWFADKLDGLLAADPLVESYHIDTYAEAQARLSEDL